MSNEIALVPMADIKIMAEAIASSGLFGIKTSSQAFALMLIAMPPTSSRRRWSRR